MGGIPKNKFFFSFSPLFLPFSLHSHFLSQTVFIQAFNEVSCFDNSQVSFFSFFILLLTIILIFYFLFFIFHFFPFSVINFQKLLKAMIQNKQLKQYLICTKKKIIKVNIDFSSKNNYQKKNKALLLG